MFRSEGIFASLVLGCLSGVLAYGDYGRCEPITIPLCMDLRYNETRMPNLVDHTSQRDAAIHIQEFLPLVEFGCSPLLQYFLCSMYAPMCTEQVDETLIIPACRPMCLQVRARCEPVLLRLNLKWPDILDCSRLPERSGRTNPCMQPPQDIDLADTPSDTVLGPMVTKNAEWLRLLESIQGKTTTTPTTNRPRGTCPERFVYLSKQPENGTCAPLCGIDVYFRHSDKAFAEIWMTVWASLCLACTVLTVLTFLTDTSRFRYPERPIIFIAFCYALYSLAYILRLVVGAKGVSCGHAYDDHTQYDFLVTEGLTNPWCVVCFLLMYFFGMAGALWWVVLAVAWFLAAGRKWGNEAIESLNVYFQVTAWSIPAVKTMAVLVLRRVDADPLTGLCSVGNQDPMTLLGFVLGPLMLYVVVGTIAVLAGFVSLLRIRRDLKHEADATSMRKLEKLMAKIGCFSILYIVPTTCVIGCLFYEQRNMRDWRQEAMTSECRLIRSGSRAGQKDCSLDSSIPNVTLHMLKIFMSLVVGITTAIWIWSSKTITSWSNFLSRIFGRNRKSNAHVCNPKRNAQVQYRKCPPPKQNIYVSCV